MKNIRTRLKSPKARSKNPFVPYALAGLLALVGGDSAKYAISHKPDSVYAAASTPYQQITFDGISKLDGVERVLATQGERPEVILVVQKHPSMNNPFEESFSKEPFDTMQQNIETICNQLYDKYNVRSAMFEGLDENSVQGYRNGNSGGSLQAVLGNGTSMDKYTLALMHLINGRRWNLYSGEKSKLWDELREQEAPVVNVNNRCAAEMSRVTQQIGNDTLGRGEDLELLNQKLNEALAPVAARRQEELDKILTPEFFEKMYGVAIVKRDSYVTQNCLDCRRKGETPIIVVLGCQHLTDFVSQLGSAGVGCAVIQPRGISKDPLSTRVSLEDYSRDYIKSEQERFEGIEVDIQQK